MSGFIAENMIGLRTSIALIFIVFIVLSLILLIYGIKTKNKKRILGVYAIYLAASVLFAVWFNSPVRISRSEPDEIESIEIFNGNTGESAEITDDEEISRIIDNLNSVKVKREKITFAMGYSLRITINYKRGFHVWDEFIVNTQSYIRKGVFAYEVSEGQIDYEYLYSFVHTPEPDPVVQPEA